MLVISVTDTLLFETCSFCEISGTLNRDSPTLEVEDPGPLLAEDISVLCTTGLTLEVRDVIDSFLPASEEVHRRTVFAHFFHDSTVFRDQTQHPKTTFKIPYLTIQIMDIKE